VNFIRGRLRRLEESGHGACPEYNLKPGRTLVYYPERGESAPEVPTCPECGRPLAHVVRVVYEGEEGGRH
jgi:hypothetical protein